MTAATKDAKDVERERLLNAQKEKKGDKDKSKKGDNNKNKDNNIPIKPSSYYNYSINKENSNKNKLFDYLVYIFQFGGTGPFVRVKDMSDRDRAAEDEAHNPVTQDIAEVAELGLNTIGVGARLRNARALGVAGEEAAGIVEAKV